MNYTKEDFAHCISKSFFRSSAWRDVKKKSFPSDARNGRAAQQLLELESQIQVQDDAWEDIVSYYDETDAHFLAAVSDTNRDVGFRTNPRDFAAWLDILRSNLKLRSVVA
jgi:hypothetical protein